MTRRLPVERKNPAIAKINSLVKKLGSNGGECSIARAALDTNYSFNTFKYQVLPILRELYPEIIIADDKIILPKEATA